MTTKKKSYRTSVPSPKYARAQILITLSTSLLKEIDAKANEQVLSRSNYLEVFLRAALNAKLNPFRDSELS